MNKVLRRITQIVSVVWILSICALDSSDELAILLCSASTVYLGIVGGATHWFDDFLKEVYEDE